jgi:DNA-binding beta-propeller fold protein YncE
MQNVAMAYEEAGAGSPILLIANYDENYIVRCPMTIGDHTSSDYPLREGCLIPGYPGTPEERPGGIDWNLDGPDGIAISSISNGRDMLYIVNHRGNTVTQCIMDVMSSGFLDILFQITSCAVPPGITWHLDGPVGIAISGNMAYITNERSNTVTQCTIGGDGSITSCAIPF